MLAEPQKGAPSRRRIARRAGLLCAAVLLLPACASPRNDALSLDFYTPPAVAGYPPKAPSVDAPSVRSPYRENWQPQRIVVPIARPWTQAPMRLGDWPARSARDRAQYPFPPATTLEPGENVALPPIPVVFEAGAAALELALLIPRALLYTSYAPARDVLDPFERAPAWERAGSNPDAPPALIRQGAPAPGSDAPPSATPSP